MPELSKTDTAKVISSLADGRRARIFRTRSLTVAARIKSVVARVIHRSGICLSSGAWRNAFAAVVGTLFVARAVAQEVPAVLQDADPSWLMIWNSEIDRLVDSMSSAYNMDEDTKQALRQELEVRLVLQRDYETKMNQELEQFRVQAESEGADSSGDDVNSAAYKMTVRMSEMTDAMPLADLEVAKWVETHIPQDAVPEGRQRLEEIRLRRFTQMGTEAADIEQRAGRKAALADEARAMNTAVDTETGRPIPRGDLQAKIEQDRLQRRLKRYVPPALRPKRGTEINGHSAPADVMAASPAAPASPPPARVAPTAPPPRPGQAGPAKPIAAAPVRPVELPAAPPLDDWDKHVISVAERYNFDEAQVTNARSILLDLRRRALQYQQSRAEDFKRANAVEDPKARAEQLAQLNRPFNALFDELKNRLESLPTLQQRQGATKKK